MQAELFVKTYPVLFHMAHHEALPGIRKHGLLCTSALLDLFEIHGAGREKIECQMRPASVEIRHPVHGKAVIRDQKPIVNDRRLQKALGNSATPRQFHKLLNSMVFFWVSPSRLETLRNAVAYRAEPQLVLTLDTRLVVEAYGQMITLCPMNSGCCRPMPHPRSPEIFQSIANYDFEHWSKKKGGASKGVVECSVKNRIWNIEKFLIKSEIVG
jgi:hypothetical protein